MDRATKNKILIRYVSTLEDKHGSVRAAEENGDKLFKEMRAFVKQFFEDRGNETSTTRGIANYRWTEEEEEYVKQYYETEGAIAVSEVLGMSPSQVQYKAKLLGLTKPKADSTYNKLFIIKNHKKMSRNEIAEALGLSYSGVLYYLRLLKKEGKISNPLVLRDDSPSKKWSEAEADYLSKHYPTTTTIEVAEALGRSENAVSMKAYKMGIKKKRG